MKATKTPLKGRRASTYRLEPGIQVKLDLLSELTHTTRNQLVNEAVGGYIVSRSGALEADMNAALQKIRSLKITDTDYEREIDTVVRSETLYANEDPAEGSVFDNAAKSGPRKKGKY